MSYIVPRDKPNKCTNCIYVDRITYDCKLMYGDDYQDFESQYKNCPLIEIPTPHGRLIDIDDAIESYGERAELGYVSQSKFLNVVIEAEGSEE